MSSALPGQTHGPVSHIWAGISAGPGENTLYNLAPIHVKEKETPDKTHGGMYTICACDVMRRET